MKDILKRIGMKLTSSKLLITVWSMIIVSYMVFTKTTNDNPYLVGILASTPIAYCGLNVVQKNIQNKEVDNDR